MSSSTATKTQAQARNELLARRDRLGTWRKVAGELAMNPGYVCAVARGTKPASPKLLRALGLKAGKPASPKPISEWSPKRIKFAIDNRTVMK